VPAYETLHALYNDICASVFQDFSNLARERNAKLAVSKLPGDLLRQVAAFVPTPVIDEMTQTCHEWRNQLIGHQHLWRDTAVSVGYSDYRQPTQLRLQLERAQGAPRSITLKSWTSINTADDTTPARIPILLREPLGHLTTLNMEMYAFDGTCWMDVFRLPVPALVRLRLRFDTEGIFRLPEDLFSDDSPRLREVHLDNIGLPETNCVALRGVTTLRYFGVQLLKGDELGRIFARCPNLDHLTIDAASGESSNALSHTQQLPHLTSLRILSFVWPGALDDLISGMRSRTGTQVYLGWPRPVHVEEALSQLGRPAWTALKVNWAVIPSTFRMGQHTPKVSVVASSGDGSSQLGAMFVEPDRLVRQMVAAGPRLSRVRHLTIPDDLWLLVLESRMPVVMFVQLQILTLHLTPAIPPPPPPPPPGTAAPNVPAASARYTHMFVLQAPGLKHIAPKLEEIRLVRDPVRAYPRFTSVDAVGAHLAQWLPPTVKKLVLRGVRIVEPGAALVRAGVSEIAVESHEVAAAESRQAREEAERWAWNHPFREPGMP